MKWPWQPLGKVTAGWGFWILTGQLVGGAGSGPSHLQFLHPWCPSGGGGIEKLDTLQGILSTFLEEDSLLDILKEIVNNHLKLRMLSPEVKKEDEVQAIGTLMEKQAQIVGKPGWH